MKEILDEAGVCKARLYDGVGGDHGGEEVRSYTCVVYF